MVSLTLYFVYSKNKLREQFFIYCKVLLNVASKQKLYGWQSQGLYSLWAIIICVVPLSRGSHCQTVARNW